MLATFHLLLAFSGCGLVSFILFYYLYHHEDQAITEIIETKDKAGLKRVKNELKTSPHSLRNVLMSKWVSFGGGFYGVMAVLTYLVVEFYEIIDFLTSESGLWETISNLGIGDLVSFFVNSIMNFVTAIVWPVYWLKTIHGYPTWVWFVAVYLGYLLGQFLAKIVLEKISFTQS